MANNSTTSAGIISTAPAPISAEARATCAALSASSARASANSLPISLASWLTASPSRSGIERLLAEAIAIALIAGLATCVAGRGAACTVIAPAVVDTYVKLLAGRCVGRTLQEAHRAKAGENSQTKERGRLPPRKILGFTQQVVEVAGPDGVRHRFDLGGGLADIGAGNRQILVELPRSAPHGIGNAADIFGAGVLLVVHRVLQF